ncbi:CGNR zinc finger domain-containing protein [Inquilinus sp. Marseille-Q2685]|uniref:CGNR zinc finger domain-containing protein n=1 Tax=Inquilinus sp. Marseille-Q2685 TaxID=2866581 RepID=UPI001CE42786|nr:CGNR zinc finger domain-containing protein [Inquilinus sp. Marseille-Q2685]
MQTQAPSYAVRPPKRIGGSLSLDFVNTEAWRGDVPQRGERLTSYGELALWAGHLGILDRAGVRRLTQEAAQRPEAAAEVLATALRLRGALGRILTAPAAASAADLAVLNGVLARAPTRTGLAATKTGFTWTMTETDPLEQPLWPVVWDAAELLVSGRAERVGSCSDPDCAWVFLDTSRNRSRRWCSMADCGNRHKARRHYERVCAS